jgi:hypothetical protein
MESVLSILGLLLTSASAIWLLAHDIKQKNRRGDHLLKRQDLVASRDATRREVEKRARLLQNANKSLDPSGEHQRYDVDVMTENVRRDLETAERDLAQANEALEESAKDAWPAPVHFGAFGLLLAGIVCQLVAEIMKTLANLGTTTFLR